MKTRLPIPLWGKVTFYGCLAACVGYAIAIAFTLPHELAVFVGLLWYAMIYTFFVMCAVAALISLVVRISEKDDLNDDEADSSDVANLVP